MLKINFISTPEELAHGGSTYGADMGRPDTSLNADTAGAWKFFLRKLRLVDGDYDVGGAYWGASKTGDIYWAQCEAEVFEDGRFQHQVFIARYLRCKTRQEAIDRIRKEFPKAIFYKGTPLTRADLDDNRE